MTWRKVKDSDILGVVVLRARLRELIEWTDALDIAAEEVHGISSAIHRQVDWVDRGLVDFTDMIIDMDARGDRGPVDVPTFKRERRELNVAVERTKSLLRQQLKRLEKLLAQKVELL